MYFAPFVVNFIVFIFTISYPLASLNITNPKIKLFEILGISEDASFDKALFDLLIDNTDSPKIEE
tara:strand:- start:297 stop:491 length:195 start_codon:yes stop_codon:yes gene_type:complete